MKLIGVFLLCCVLAGPVATTHAAQATATCDDFKIQAIAQIRLTDENAKQLDPDGDGIACEELPGGSSASSNTGNNKSETDRQQARSKSDELTNQEDTYFEDLNDESERFAEASTEIGELFSEAGDDTTVILTRRWQDDLEEQLKVWQKIGEEAQDLKPSDRQEHIHALWIEVNRLVTLAADDYLVSVDTIDPELLEQGNDRVGYATLLLNDLTVAINAFRDDPNTPVEPEHVIAPVDECDEFTDYDDAQLYYAANPEEQGTIDPDFDGLACEVFFEEE